MSNKKVSEDISFYMRKKMTTYCFEDFIADDVFFAAAKEGNLEYLSKIKKDLVAFPYQEKMAENTFYLIHTLKIQRPEVSDIDINEEWTLLKRSIENKNRKNKKKWSFVFWVSNIAAVLMIGFVGWAFFSQDGDMNKEVVLAYFDKMQIESNKVQLVLNPEKMMELESDSVDIQLRANGSVVVNSTSVVLPGGTGTKDTRKDAVADLSQLIVPKGKRSTITFSDGTKMWINSGSKILYPQTFAADKREIYVDGEVFIEAAKDKNRPLIVHTEKMDVQVLGTSFNVMAYRKGQMASVVLVDGKVEVQTNTENKIVLSPDQLLEFVQGKTKVSNVDVYDYICWKDGLMKFDGTPLDVILFRLSNYYDVNLIFDSYMSEIKCVGKLDLNEDINKVLNTIALTAPVKFETLSDGSIKAVFVPTK